MNNSLLDEFSRVEEIEGQRSANVLTAAKPRRKLVGQALEGDVDGGRRAATVPGRQLPVRKERRATAGLALLLFR
ncbi:hypothetical protein V1460_01720 [Streptomyces sp. SCSIO 30461]|uniref:hypothetical protein n=1 Tax=Streptomyces sp. SCSIO 30461 TaxID=3118085 RepID=UPI0030D2E519